MNYACTTVLPFSTYVLLRKRSSYLSALGTILKDNWEWRKQISRLSLFELKKKSRGAVLSWAWFFIKPAMYIFCFWFALEVGLRVGRTMGEGAPPYLLWLCAGLIPWFFMQDMLSPGSDVLHRYKYLVNKVKFPLSGISTLFTLATLFVNVVLFIILFCIYAAYGMPFDIYLLQVPILLILMAVFWDMFSIFSSQLSGMSKDFGQLISALKQPFFWLSGIIFNMSIIAQTSIGWVADLMVLNPVTFFAYAFRDAFCEKVWFWEDPMFIGGFAIVFAITFFLMLFTYKNLNEEVADVL